MIAKGNLSTTELAPEVPALSPVEPEVIKTEQVQKASQAVPSPTIAQPIPTKSYHQEVTNTMIPAETAKAGQEPSRGAEEGEVASLPKAPATPDAPAPTNTTPESQKSDSLGEFDLEHSGSVLIGKTAVSGQWRPVYKTNTGAQYYVSKSGVKAYCSPGTKGERDVSYFSDDFPATFDGAEGTVLVGRTQVSSTWRPVYQTPSGSLFYVNKSGNKSACTPNTKAERAVHYFDQEAAKKLEFA